MRSFAMQINSSGMPLHVLINNAGLGALPGLSILLMCACAHKSCVRNH